MLPRTSVHTILWVHRRMLGDDSGVVRKLSMIASRPGSRRLKASHVASSHIELGDLLAYLSIVPASMETVVMPISGYMGIICKPSS